MGSGGRNNPRGASNTFDAAKYWRNTLLIGIPLLAIPLINLIGIGWFVHRIRKYNELRKREQTKLVNKLNTRLANIMLKNNKYVVNAEVLDEDGQYIKVVDAEGKELLIDKSYIAVIEPITMDPMD
jgi:hypothetical protein